MIAKIGKGTNLYGALSYNLQKVEQENGTVLQVHNMYERLNGDYSIAHLSRSFALHLTANRNTEKPVLHISLNPDPDDHVSDEKFCQIAHDYMNQLGYGEQPYVIFKHTDIDRVHIHIVSLCIDEQGVKINDSFEKVRSMEACRKLEQNFGLKPATEKKKATDQQLFRPVDYRNGNIKGQIASVVRYLPKHYSFQNFGTYNALLSLFNITAEKVSAAHSGQEKQGLVYFATGPTGGKISSPFKASRFGQYAGLAVLEKHFATSAGKMKESGAKAAVKDTLLQAMYSTTNEPEFKKYLVEQGINAVIRRNEQGRLYGITFIDHESRSVWNGSQLGKQLSANAFHQIWEDEKEQINPSAKHDLHNHSTISKSNHSGENHDDIHPFFEFLNSGSSTSHNSDYSWLNFLPEAQADDFEEELFTRRTRKKKRIKRRGQR